MFYRILFSIACVATLAIEANAQNINPERLQQYLKQFPDADTDKDGTLSMSEAQAYLGKMRGKKAPKAEPTSSATFAPTFADVHYGPHERNVLDFWQAKSDKPTPVVVFIHGGGFVAGDKSKAGGISKIQPFLDAGVSFAAINYRYRTTAPIQDVLHDCARAIQFLRNKSVEWNIDKTRFASYGGSAGAGTSLWLAFHDDMADANSADPVLRESTRLVCAGAGSTQFSYDILQWPAMLGEDNAKKYGDSQEAPGYYGLKTDEELKGPIGQKLRADCDMLGLISNDDPPVFLTVTRDAGPIMNRGDYLHHPKHAQAIYDQCKKLGVGVTADIPGLDIKPPADGPTKERDFLLKYLVPTSIKN
ncbi:MAG: alpha/beta hydrolase [Pirellulaceae bacterium]|nr:alpha/beta hydrolase [Pirellulaceae bacterium]